MTTGNQAYKRPMVVTNIEECDEFYHVVDRPDAGVCCGP